MTTTRAEVEEEEEAADAGLRAHDPPCSPLTLFVCMYEATTENIRMTNAALFARLEPRGPVKALNYNFGHKSQPGFERFEKRPKPPAAAPAAPPRSGLAPASVRVRKPQGDATCFNTALEVTIIPDLDGDPAPPAALRELYAQKPDKSYIVKSFPTTGKTQVSGVVCAGLEDGLFIARLWARFLTDAGVAADPAAPVVVAGERPIMLNFKFFLYRDSERVILNLAAVAAHLENAKAAAAFGAAAPEEEEGGAPRDARARLAWGRLPFPVREVKHVQDDQKISFKFVVNAAGKKVRVNMFYRGKVNILGAGEFESPRVIYDYLSALLAARRAEFVRVLPLPDRPAPRPRAPGGGKSAPPMAGLSSTNPPAAPKKPPAPPAVDLAAVLAMARELDHAAFDEVEGQDVEDHQEDPLEHGAERRRVPPLDPAPEARDDAVREDVAHHKRVDEEERDERLDA